jgi:hypothetical protein
VVVVLALTARLSRVLAPGAVFAVPATLLALLISADLGMWAVNRWEFTRVALALILNREQRKVLLWSLVDRVYPAMVAFYHFLRSYGLVLLAATWGAWVSQDRAARAL